MGRSESRRGQGDTELGTLVVGRMWHSWNRLLPVSVIVLLLLLILLLVLLRFLFLILLLLLFLLLHCLAFPSWQSVDTAQRHGYATGHALTK